MNKRTHISNKFRGVPVWDLLPHTCTQDGWFLQPERRPARLPRRTVPSNCICRCSRMRARLSPPRVLLPHTCTQDGWFLQPKRRPARLPRTPIEATPLSATSAELGLGLGLGLGLDSLSHSSSHALPFFSPPSFHTLSLSPAFTSVWWSA
jgi:hypothetical protein